MDKEFRVGEWVLLHNTRVKKGLSPKFTKPWDGPFYVSSQGLNHTYKIIRCSNNKAIRSFIHANRLKPYNNPAHRKHLDPPTATEPIDDSHQPATEDADHTNQPDDTIRLNDAIPPPNPLGNQPQTPIIQYPNGTPDQIPADVLPEDDTHLLNPQPYALPPTTQTGDGIQNQNPQPPDDKPHLMLFMDMWKNLSSTNTYEVKNTFL